MKSARSAMVVIAVALTVFTSSQTFATTTVPTTAKVLRRLTLGHTSRVGAGFFGNVQISGTCHLVGSLQLVPTGSSRESFVNPSPVSPLTGGDTGVSD